MFNIADVALKISGPKSVFSYSVLKEMGGIVNVGQLVEVNIRNRRVLGIIYRLAKTADTAKLNPIDKIVHPALCLTHIQIELAQWMSESTLSSIGVCLFSFMPVVQPPPELENLPKTPNPSTLVKLNSAQNIALEIIQKSTIPALLNCITGSGKNE